MGETFTYAAGGNVYRLSDLLARLGHSPKTHCRDREK